MIRNCHPEKILTHLTHYPGVYQMLDKYSKILYIGKAKNLKSRLNQYFSGQVLSHKTKALIAKVCTIEVTVTENESEALLLENALIKTHKPRYNISLKDDKSYPYIAISKHKHPSITMYRGAKKKNLHYFGPYSSVNMIKESLALVKKIFKVRSCRDSVFKGRKRPCLEYQLNLCSAPCVGYISDEDYLMEVNMILLFLAGKNKDILDKISEQMHTAASALDFEKAVYYRDKLKQLRNILSEYQAKKLHDSDVIALASQDEFFCVQILFIRSDRQVGQKTLFFKNLMILAKEEILAHFLSLYYLGKKTPSELVLSHKIIDKKLLESNLSSKIIIQPREAKQRYLRSAMLTANAKLKQYQLECFRPYRELERLRVVLSLPSIPMHIECFDISHMMGEASIASCVVFVKGKAKKSSYRSFNIKSIKAGDDYGAMKQVLMRHYVRRLSEQKPLPHLLLVDGGIGQAIKAQETFKNLAISGVAIVGVAKSIGRKAGLETLIMLSHEGEVQKIKLKPDDSALILVNRIRDEAHRFAISAHRNKMKKYRQISILEKISGIGKIKRSAILNHFGGLQEVMAASKYEIGKVKGINTKLAHKIYQKFHTS